MDGSTPTEDVEEILDISLPEGEYDTLGGMIMSELGRIPEKEDMIEIEGYVFTVESLDDKRIERVLVVKKQETAD